MLDANQVQAASTAVRELRVALSNFFLYSSGNNMALLSLQRFIGALDVLFESLPSVTVGESEGRLVVESTPLDERTTGSTNMIKDLFLTHKIHALTFLKGADTEEIKTLFSLLKPKALPTGMSIAQALVQHSVRSIKANEKVFVAIGEGEKVVSAEEAKSLPKEQNLQEALEALQYFLQIFAKVKPDENKKEVARKLMDNMGGWLAAEGEKPSASASDTKAWKDILGGFEALRDGLSDVKKPTDVGAAKNGLEEILSKLVSLAESQGVEARRPADRKGERKGPAAAPREGPSPDEQFLAAVEKGNLEALWDPGQEEVADRCLARLQGPEGMENLEKLWASLWEKAFSGDEKTQALVLRHLNRLQWNQLPRFLQLEGLRNLGRFIQETRRPAVYPIGLTLFQDWIPMELAKPDWNEVLGLVQVLRSLATKKPPALEKQDLASKVALETVFCEPILENLLQRYEGGTPDGNSILKLFSILGLREAPFLFEKMEKEPVESESWKKAVALLCALQAQGHHVFEYWLEWPERRGHMEKFLEIFKKIPPSGEMDEYFERHWGTFAAGARSKILEIVGLWKKKGFRPFLVRLLEKPEEPEALQVLRALAVVGMEGDSASIAGALHKFHSHSKEKEKFWVEAAQTLGELKDPAAIPVLQEWADKYKLFEHHKKERSLEVRKAAIEALGHFAQAEAREFLEGLQKGLEKELVPTLEQALKK